MWCTVKQNPVDKPGVWGRSPQQAQVRCRRSGVSLQTPVPEAQTLACRNIVFRPPLSLLSLINHSHIRGSRYPVLTLCTGSDIALSSAPEVTSSYVMTWVRVGVNRAQTLYDTVASSVFYLFPLVSIKFWTMCSASFSEFLYASVRFRLFL